MTVALTEPVLLSKLDPAAKTMSVRVSWDLLPDLKIPPEGDLVAFLLNKDNIAPLNEDFIFFNQTDGVDGNAILSLDDSVQQNAGGRQTLTFKLDAMRYEITNVKIAFSLYRGGERDQSLRFLDTLALEIIGHDAVLARYELPPRDHKDSCAIELIDIQREANDWLLTPLANGTTGLEELAHRYGIVAAGAN